MSTNGLDQALLALADMLTIDELITRVDNLTFEVHPVLSCAAVDDIGCRLLDAVLALKTRILSLPSPQHFVGYVARAEVVATCGTVQHVTANAASEKLVLVAADQAVAVGPSNAKGE